MKYIGVVGSRVFGTQRPDSDVDVLVINDASFSNEDVSENYHVLKIPVSSFIDCVTYTNTVLVYGIQYLYPSEFLEENELSQYIIDNRERIIKAVRKRMFRTLYQYITYSRYSPSWYYDKNKKAFMRSILYYQIMKKYLATGCMKDSIQVDEKTAELVCKLHDGEISYDEYHEILENCIKDIEDNILPIVNSVEDDEETIRETQLMLNHLFSK